MHKLGPRWFTWRAGYELRKRSGLLKRRFPTPSWDDVRLADLVIPGSPTAPSDYRAFRLNQRSRFFFDPGRLPDRTTLDRVAGPAGRERTLAVADDYARGRFLYYNDQTRDLGWPPDWLLNPSGGGRHEATTHWCDYPTFSPELGDIKDVWEPSRFAAAFWLVRAYALTADEKYPAAFWTLFESWRAQNPPNRGPNWKCGQETALRSMAWCFALCGFWDSPGSTAERLTALVTALALHAERIAGNITFAVSQKNNHALSEAVGLLTIGLLVPELKGAKQWECTGRQVLERAVPRQVYEDGSYVQQSMNYHRVMLHDCLWAIRLAQLNGRPLSRALTERVALAAEFLFELLDLDSGRVPNYGPNDGALVLPLSSFDYLDYRPTVQAARYQATGHRVLANGPWDEMLLWLFGPSALADDPQSSARDQGGSGHRHSQSSRRFDAGGYYTLRGRESWCMVRCHSYRDRPAHVDMLHLDLWYKGVNVLGDSGTYKYYAPEVPMLERYFKDIAAHNTVEIDGRGPLDLVSRFIWLPWPRAECLEHTDDCWQGEHHAYYRPPWNVVHHRAVRRIDDSRWEVSDDLLGEGQHAVKLRWHVADGPFAVRSERHGVDLDLPCGKVGLEIDGPAGLRITVHRGVETAAQASGWRSEYYGQRTPRPTLEVAGNVVLPARIVTRIEFTAAGRKGE